MIDLDKMDKKFKEIMNGIDSAIVRCHSCGNEKECRLSGGEPKDTKVIVSNYCPKCENEHKGDFWEEMWFEDGKGNII